MFYNSIHDKKLKNKVKWIKMNKDWNELFKDNEYLFYFKHINISMVLIILHIVNNSIISLMLFFF